MTSPSTTTSEGGPLEDGEADVKRFLNRELSWLEFNRRVLHEALDDRTPLLERVQFLSIFTSNLDEFVMKRAGGLKRQIAAGIVSRSLDGMTAKEQMAAIRTSMLPMLHQQAECFLNVIKPALRDHHIHLLTWDELTATEQRKATGFFRSNVFPVLTPLAVDSGHPFPLISNLSKSLGVALSHPGKDEQLFARVKIPEVLPQWVRVDDEQGGEYRFVSLLQIVWHNLADLFPGMTIRHAMPFRVTRNADIERDDEDAEDLLELLEEELRARRFASIVRLEHGPDPDPWMLRFLVGELGLHEEDVYELPGELDYTDLKPIIDLPIPSLRVAPWTPIVPKPFEDQEADLFATIRSGDLLVHHPFESFSATVERFLQAAADDPDVLAIKMTLYRTGDDSPFINTLIRAAEAGKQVVCMVELKARFDEQRNIQCAQTLENAGVHVVYGVVGLKTHTKTALVVRREGDALRTYAHIGTGNYHVGTARLYTDLGLFTADRALAGDVVELFNFLTGRSLKRDYDKLLVAPVNMRKSFLEKIDGEVAHKQAGRPAHIVAKMNSLQDRRVIDSLYAASRAGVRIDLIVRGFCCLRPGVPGLSENIRVTSIIGRFLEHSRVWYFRNGDLDPANGEFYLGSADWMSRNLDMRVEAVTPIETRALRERLFGLLELMLHDQRQAWDMHPDGSYAQRQPTDPRMDTGTHETLMGLATGKLEEPPPPPPSSRGVPNRRPLPGPSSTSTPGGEPTTVERLISEARPRPSATPQRPDGPI